MKRYWIFLFLLFLAPVAANAGPVVYPVRQAFGFDDPSLARNAPAFAGWLAGKGVASLSQGFEAAFREKFGGEAVDDIDTGNKHRVMVASLHLVRASQYSVPKIDGTTEIHLPITLSIVFTNPATGEVIFSFTRTSYASVRVASSESREQVDAQLRQTTSANYGELLALLIQEAKQGYKPTQIGAKISRTWKGLYVLDKGSKAGIVRDDDLTDATGNIIKVRYAAEDYAIAVPLLVDKVEDGQVFSKYANQSIVNQLKKPRVLTLSGAYGDDQLKAITGFFESELSKESAFTLLPVNENLQAVLAAVGRDTRVGQYQISNCRTMPDYILKFSYVSPRVYDIGEEGKFGYRVYEQYVLGELLDKQGRIVYSAIGYNEIKDRDVGGMVFDIDARREILLKNSVKALAEQFAGAIRFSRFTLPVTQLEGSLVSLEDASRQLRPGQTVAIYRNIGQSDGVNGNITVPIWEAEVKEAANGVVLAELLLPLAAEDGGKGLKVKKKDIVLVESISAESAAKSDTSVAYCTDVSSKIGELEVDDFPVISRGFGYLLPYSLYDVDDGYLVKVNESLKYGGFRDSLKLGGINTGGRCLLPVQRTAIENRQCDGGYCSSDIRMAIGYRLYSEQDKKGVGSEVRLSVKNIQQGAFGPVIQSEISRSALGLLRDTVVKVHY